MISTNRRMLRVFAFLSLPGLLFLACSSLVWAAIMRPASLDKWVFVITLCATLPATLCVEVICQTRKPTD